MKVLIIQTELNAGNLKGLFHHGSLGIATYLKMKGHDVSYWKLSNSNLSKEQLLADVAAIDPGLIGFSVNTDEWFYVGRLASWIKERFRVPILCGGAHATVAPAEVLANQSIDIVCRGEGEHTVEELCHYLEAGKDYRHVENLWGRIDGKTYSNPVRPLVENLDELPFPDPGLIDFDGLLADINHVASFMVGRGCPFDCTYCINRGLHQLYEGKGKSVRRRSQANIVEAIRSMVDRYPAIQAISINDDILSLDKPWFREFCSLYTRVVGLPWGCFMRIEGIDREFLTLFKESGGVALDIGVESGNEWLRREVLGRKMSNQRIIDTFKLIDEFEIGTSSLNMVGLPFETPEMIEETIELNRKLEPTFLLGGVFQPYPGTRLREICLEHGWLREDAPFLNRAESILNLPALSKSAIDQYARKLNHVGIDIHVRKKPFGDFDFLVRLGEAEIEQEFEGDVEVTAFGFRDGFFSSGFVLKTAPPSKVTYLLQIPQGAILVFAIGFDQDYPGHRKSGTLFIIEIAHGEGFSQRQKLFARYVNPWRNPENSGWLGFELPLDSYFGKEVKLSFIARPGPLVGEVKSRAGWQRPHLTRITPVHRTV
jgi:anaerobic magnesium-protoporphyrin IX monomethyl ester cyclase